MNGQMERHLAVVLWPDELKTQELLDVVLICNKKN